MLDTLFESAVFRLRRLFHTLPPYIIEPTVIAAPDAGLLYSTEFQRSPTMRTMESQDT
jgi:hypothetical protein